MKYDYTQIAKCHIGAQKFDVVQINNSYYQVRLNRKKIGKNEQNRERAIKSMLLEAEYSLLDLFAQ